MTLDEMQALPDTVIRQISLVMDKTAEDMIQSMKKRLIERDHIDTGQLINSFWKDTKINNDIITTDINIEARSDEGTWYAEFLEYGTGIYNENGDGRQTPWAYFTGKYDEDGKEIWVTTKGNHHDKTKDPFIRPSVAEHVRELDENIDHILRTLERN